MQLTGTLRPQRFLRCASPHAVEYTPTKRPCCLLGLPESRRSELSKQACRALLPAGEDVSPAAPSQAHKADAAVADQADQPSETPAPVVEVTAVPAPSPASPPADDSVERDWLEPVPGDWGGVADRQSIREPDSSGVIFFFILITGLSFGVHQVIRLLGSRRTEEQLVRPAPAAAVVSSWSRSRPTVQPSTSEAVADYSGPSTAAAEPSSSRQDAPTADTADGAQQEAPERPGPSQADDSADAGLSAERRMGGRRMEGRQVETDSEAGAQEKAETDGNYAEQALEAQQRQEDHDARVQPLPVASNSSADAASAVDATAERASTAPGLASAAVGQPELQHQAQEQQQQIQTGPGPGPHGEAFERPTEGTTRRMEAAPQAASGSLPSFSGAGATAGPAAPTPPGRPAAAQQGPAGPGPSSSTGAAGQPAPSRATSNLAALYRSSSLPAGPVASAVYPDGAFAAAARVALPSVRPEPLSRAPDSSALAHLPKDDSLPSLRERAQLALRAAAAASEASQRAAAYAAAASSAASRAAEAAERAAAAASVAQVGLESAAESAIMAAEARVAQATEAATEAESRAASAAAHATAYQDMSQSQADIAEQAAKQYRPAAPGPLSHLQQLWRNASSAFAHGHNPSSHQSQPGPSPAAQQGEERQTGLPEDQRSDIAHSMAQGSAADGAVGGGEGGPGSRGAAKTISTTVKGLLSWLGQGDGSGDGR